MAACAITRPPVRRNPFFTGREEVLMRLHNTLHAGTVAALTQALSGLGGIGKTHTAVEYAYRFRDDYSAVLWVRAETREMVIVDFVALAALLDIPEKDEQDQMRIVEAVKRWLDHNTDWLLILDNVEDFTILGDFLPSRSKGHVVLTTRTQSAGTFAQRIDLQQMETDEGALFLLRRAKLLEHDASLEDAPEVLRLDARCLSQLMGGLPLALDQAGAYIDEIGCSLSEYRGRYQVRQMTLLERRGNTAVEHPQSVCTTFSLCFEKVKHTNPIAAELLQFCAFLAADAIPEKIVTEGTAELCLILEPMNADSLALDNAVAALRKYSLLRRTSETKMLTVHRLVQAVLKERMDESTQRQWAERAVRAVNRAFLEPEEVFQTGELYQPYIVHAQVCASLIEQWDIASQEAGQLLYRIGAYFHAISQFLQAEVYYRRSLAIARRVLESEHPEIAKILNQLAVVSALLGNDAQAESLFQQARAMRERVLGPEHPDTIASLNNLGVVSMNQGKYAQAESLFLQLFTILGQVSGVKPTSMAGYLNNLGRVYYKLGKYVQAESYYQQALIIWKEMPGAEHPNTATALLNLGDLSCVQGKYAQAESLYRQALAIWEKTVGLESPPVAFVFMSLAQLYVKQGQYEPAKSFHEQALAIQELILGPEHPDTAKSLNHLAVLHVKLGQCHQAETLFQRALDIQECKQGTEHPDAVTTVKNYADLLRKMKREEEASVLEARVEAMQMRPHS